jgi:FixJ family two-component response regulator
MSKPDMLIAVIDDDDSFRVAMEGLLRSMGYKTLAFSSAETFLASPDGERADCILSDIQMPGMSGIELKQRLDEQHRLAPVIMVTARTEPTIRQQAIQSGAACLLRKPFEMQTLVDCLGRVLLH